MLLHGPVRVPAEAAPGTAIVRVALPPTSAYKSLATDLEVVIR